MKITYQYPTKNNSNKLDESSTIDNPENDINKNTEYKTNESLSDKFLIKYLICCAIIIAILKIADKIFWREI